MYGAHSKFDNGTPSTEYRRSRKVYCLASGTAIRKEMLLWDLVSECRWPTLATVPSNEFCSKSSTFGKTPKHYKQRGPLHHQYGSTSTHNHCTPITWQSADCDWNSSVWSNHTQSYESNNLRCRRQADRPPLLPRHRTARRHWWTLHLRWQRVQWGRVMFTDESRISIQFNDGRVRVYRRPGERFADVNVRQRHRFGGGSVMVWGGISIHHRTPPLCDGWQSDRNPLSISMRLSGRWFYQAFSRLAAGQFCRITMPDPTVPGWWLTFSDNKVSAGWIGQHIRLTWPQ